MATHAEIQTRRITQMNARGFSVKLISPMEIELQKLDKFFEGILKIHFEETGEPE
jgi:hypothetical protein